MVKDACWEIQLMSFLEDFGLVRVMNGPNDFGVAMTKHGFVLPDWTINAIVLATFAYWAIDSKILGGFEALVVGAFAVWFFVIREIGKKTWMG